MTQLERYQESASLAPIDANEPSALRVIDIYAGGLVDTDSSPRVDAIATISAGRRNEKGLPQAVREGDQQHIYLHDRTGRAPGLRSILEINEWKRLTIAFPYNNPNAFIQQRPMLYSATELQAYADEHELTLIRNGQHITYPAGSDEYAEWFPKLKNTVSVYFAISVWDDDGASRVIFPDGLGLYRLRFTSRNSLRNLDAAIKTVQKFTGGQIAGIPFDLALDFREVAGPDGKKRTIPCWTFTMKPPESAGMLSSRTFQPIARAALAEGQALMLPVPSAESIETARTDIVDVDLDQPSDEDVALIERGGKCDKRYWNTLWHAVVRDTSLAKKEARGEFLDHYTGQRYDSLALFLDQATEDDSAKLIQAARDYLVKAGEISPIDAVPDDEDTPSYQATADDYAKTYDAAYADEPKADEPKVIDAESRPVESPVEQMDALAGQVDDEMHRRLTKLGNELDEVINDGTAEASPEPGVDAEPKELDYGLCMEAWENADKRLGVPKPFARGNADYYRTWWDTKYLPAVSKDLPF